MVTTSYNKGRYLLELREHLEKQVYPKALWSWWIMDNSTDQPTRDLVLSWKEEDEDWIKVTTHDFTDEERQERFVHPVLMNQAVSELDGGAFVHISDDDLPSPRFIGTLAAFLGYNKDKDAAYVQARWVIQQEGGGFEFRSKMPPARVIFSSRVDPYSLLDGNSVMIRVEALKALGSKPWPESWDNAFCCDGEMLQSLVQRTKIWPAATEVLLLHRTTELSTFNNTVRGQQRRPDPLGQDLPLS